MASTVVPNKPHAVFVPFPLQGHIKTMLQFAKLLHHRGFHITFVNTDFNHKRLLKSLGPNSLDGSPDFQFEAIPDGLPESNEDATQDVTLLGDSVRKLSYLAPFRALLKKLNKDAIVTSKNPPVSCIVSDGFMSLFTIPAAQEIGTPIILFYTIAAYSFMALLHYRALVEKGLAPLKDECCLTNGYLEKVIDWIPGMKDIRLKDLPTFLRVTNPDDIMFNFQMEVTDVSHEASALVFHSFDALEGDVLGALSSMLIPPVYAIGPLQLHLNQLSKDPLNVGYSLWKEETECLEWLNTKPLNSVVYVNFGSITVMTPEQLVEFGWGLANTKLPFLWVIRPDLVIGRSAVLPSELKEETKERGLIASWCPQEQVLNHPSVGGFLTHSGWGSTFESLMAGVPMICWPFFAEQPTNCHYSCKVWGVGMEINNDVKREDVEKLVRELIEGEKGKIMRNKAREWKTLAEEATGPLGSSTVNFDNLVNQVL